MAVYLPDTSSDLLYKFHGLALTDPMTLCCWFRPKDTSQTHPLMAVTKGGQEYDGWGMSARGDLGSNPLWAPEYGSDSSSGSSQVDGYVANVWQHGGAVFDDPNYRRAYLDGVGGTPNTSAVVNPPVSDLLRVGYYFFHASHYAKTDIAEVAIWDIALGAAAIADMHDNQLSAACYPTGLVLYHKLISDYVDEQGGPNLTPQGSPSFIAHPTINYDCDGDIFGPKIEVI